MISKILQSMIAYSEGSLHDINHFIKVWSHAKTIGELENLEFYTQETLEIAAIVHDIACPSLRAEYGHADGKKQEIAGPPLVEEFLAQFNLPAEQLDRIKFLVAHHHTLTEIDGIDYQILIEADYLVNADESNYTIADIRKTHDEVFKTPSGLQLLEEMYLNHRISICKEPVHEVTQESPEEDPFEIEDEDVLTYAEITGCLEMFLNWLEDSNLSRKTIEKHFYNVSFYVEEYLNYYQPCTDIKIGCTAIGGFLGDWFIRKCMWSSKTAIKESATSIKKFYKCMLENHRIEKIDYICLCDTIKEEMDTWLAAFDTYMSGELFDPYGIFDDDEV